MVSTSKGTRSYHLVHHKDGQVGPDFAPCATYPCSLHNGTDFEASSPEQAGEIAEAMAYTMYSNTNMGLSDKQANEVVKNHENRVNNMTLGEVYRQLPDDDNDFINNHVGNVLGTSAHEYNFTGHEKLMEADGYQIMMNESAKDYVNSLTTEDQKAIVNNANDPYYAIRNRALDNTEDMRADGKLYEPTDADMATAALQLELERRQLASTTDYQDISKSEKIARSRKASAIINGKVNLDEEWRQLKYGADIKRLNRQLTQLKKLYDKPESDHQYIMDRIGDYKEMLYWINKQKMPVAVKRRVMQNAFSNVSRKTQNAALRNGGEILKYAPPSRVASFMRHTTPSPKELEGLKGDARRKKIQEHRLAQLDNLLNQDDKSAFANAVFSGAINPDDAMAWSNKHPLFDRTIEHKDGTVTVIPRDKRMLDKKGNVSALMRSVHHYVRQNTIQGNPSIDADTGKPRFKVIEAEKILRNGKRVNKYPRNSEIEIKRRAANRRAYANYMNAQVKKYTEKSNFLDENGKYSPEKHAAALMKLTYGDGKKGLSGKPDHGYLPAASYVISHAHDVPKDNEFHTYDKIPDRTMAIYLDLVHQHRNSLEGKTTKKGHSRYTDKMKEYDDMLDMVYAHKYSRASESSRAMGEHRRNLDEQNA